MVILGNNQLLEQVQVRFGIIQMDQKLQKRVEISIMLNLNPSKNNYHKDLHTNSSKDQRISTERLVNDGMIASESLGTMMTWLVAKQR